MSEELSQSSINYHDDSRVLRYLLHNVKGISPVSGGVMGEALEQEYASAEAQNRVASEFVPDFEI